MEVVQEGTIIGTVACDCGAEVPIKITKGGCARAYCSAVVGAGRGKFKVERCYSFQQWGRTATAKMIEQFQKGKNHVESENRPAEQPAADPTVKPADGPGSIAEPADKRSGGIVGGVVRFFTE